MHLSVHWRTPHRQIPKHIPVVLQIFEMHLPLHWRTPRQQIPKRIPVVLQTFEMHLPLQSLDTKAHSCVCGERDVARDEDSIARVHLHYGSMFFHVFEELRTADFGQ